MKLKIYNKDGVLKTEVASDESSSHQVAIQGDNLLNLSFTLYECIKIDVNDYIDFCGERFWAVERYVPEQISTVEWKYSLKMFGIQSLISRFLVLKLVDGENEAAFSLTAPAASHLQLIVDSINAGMGTSDWKTGECVQTENIVLDYTGTYCDNALTALAEKAGTEFWFDGTTVNLTRCEHGAPVILAYGHGLTSLMRTGADNVKFFTRLFPVGSDRNIDRTRYGHTRLQLPDGTQYIDRDIESYGIIHHYEKDAFSHIYPRRVGKVSSVRVTDAKSDDGTPYKIYWFKDDSLDFNPDSYEIGGLVKQVTFQSGELNGREFEVNWHENKKEFEIITQWPYDDGRQVPGDSLVPKPEDEYILWNIRMPDKYYPLAEQEFLDAVNSYMEENRKDVSVFKSHTDYIDLNSRGISLTIGQRVRLESAQYFAGGYKETRITRISRSLDNPTDADIEISDVLSKGTITEIQDGIEETKSYVDSVSGSLPGIVKSWEGTKLTDTNLMSSARTLLEIARKAVSKEHDDNVSGVITFLKGLISELRIHARNGIEVGKYQTGKPGAGGAVLVDQDGNSRAEVDYLDVRKVAKFNKLMIQETKHVGGRMILSPASMTCSRIEETESSYKCFFETTDGDGNRVFNQFEAGDQAIRQTFNLTGSVYYWRLVVAVGDDYIELSKTDCDSGSGVPQKGDEIVQLGNRDDKTRQSAQILSAYGSGAPSYEVFNGINSYSLAGKNIAGIVYNEDTGEPQTYCYGDSYTGDRDIDDPAATFMTFQKKAGEDRKKLHIQAEIVLGAGSSGLSNLSEWAGKEQEINNAQNAADKAKEEAAKAQAVADKAQAAADAAKGAADKAQSTANSAASSASSANTELTKLKSDGSISPVEKTALKQQQSDVNAEYAQITADADKYGVNKTAYTTAYNAAKSALTKYSAVSPEYINIDSDYANISAYYTARQTILNAIAAAAKKVADDAQNAADAAQSTADNAMISAGTAQSTANDAQKTADEALRKAQEAKDYIDSTLPEEIAEINRKIDGVVENWYGDYTPSLANAPASAWTTAEEKKKHLGDTFTNTQSFVDTETTPNAGKSWRWVGDGSYRWSQIADSDAVKALQEAAKAKDTADSKRRCFVTTPYTPYDVGDMWMQGTGGDIMRCIKARSTGAYTASDWDKASRYTDDTAAKAAQAAADKAQKAADAAKGAADKAQSTANSAASSASSANTELTKLKSDGSISPVEKTALKQQQSDVNAEYAQITADADKYGVNKTAYTTAYNAAKSALTKYSAVSPEYINIDSDYANISAYYTARQTILNAIAAAAKKVADDAQNAADAAQSTADNASAKAAQAQAAADAAASAASQAGKVASDAAARLNDWANDAKISPTEKPALKDEISRIDADKTQILSGYSKYSLGTPSAYVTSHTTYREQLETLTAATPESIAIPANFRTNQTKYYSDRSAALDKISAAAKDYADTVSKDTDKKVDASKDALAQKLGYAGWSAMVSAAEAGKTVMKGGYINTQLIAAKAITAAMIAVEDLFAQTISAKAMTLEEGCHVGGFSIVNNSGFASMQAGTPMSGTGILLDKNMIGCYRDRFKTTERKVEIGNISNTEPFFIINSASAGSTTRKNIALRLGASGAVWYKNENPDKSTASINFALACPTGMTGGLRPMIRNGVNGETLSSLDYTIIVTKDMTLYLPKNPEVGQRYEFVKDATGTLIVNGNGKQIWMFGGSAALAHTIAYDFKGRAYVEYDGDTWLLTYSKL